MGERGRRGLKIVAEEQGAGDGKSGSGIMKWKVNELSQENEKCYEEEEVWRGGS